ncbi:MAG: hypothetical protein ABSG84_06620 [Acidobacteriaceae bacterium]|jgi:hypothetical protein
MADTYRIAAAPLLFTEGAHKGRLSGVTFTATSATDAREWFTINCGQFEDAFTRLMSRARARTIVAALMEGDRTEFPGFYTEDQFSGGFVYEWSPVHFVRPLSTSEGAYSS